MPRKRAPVLQIPLPNDAAVVAGILSDAAKRWKAVKVEEGVKGYLTITSSGLAESKEVSDAEDRPDQTQLPVGGP